MNMPDVSTEARERISLIYRIVYNENLAEFSLALKMSQMKASRYVGEDAQIPDIPFMLELLRSHKFIDKDWIMTGIPSQLQEIIEKKQVRNRYTDEIIQKLDSMSLELKSIRDILVLFSSME